MPVNGDEEGKPCRITVGPSHREDERRRDRGGDLQEAGGAIRRTQGAGTQKCSF